MNNYSVKEIVKFYSGGLILKTEAIALLDAKSVRGAFGDDCSYIGYDYANQRWVEVAAD